MLIGPFLSVSCAKFVSFLFCGNFYGFEFFGSLCKSAISVDRNFCIRSSVSRVPNTGVLVPCVYNYMQVYLLTVLPIVRCDVSTFGITVLVFGDMFLCLVVLFRSLVFPGSLCHIICTYVCISGLCCVVTGQVVWISEEKKTIRSQKRSFKLNLNS